MFSGRPDTECRFYFELDVSIWKRECAFEKGKFHFHGGLTKKCLKTLLFERCFCCFAFSNGYAFFKWISLFQMDMSIWKRDVHLKKAPAHRKKHKKNIYIFMFLGRPAGQPAGLPASQPVCLSSSRPAWIKCSPPAWFGWCGCQFPFSNGHPFFKWTCPFEKGMSIWKREIGWLAGRPAGWPADRLASRRFQRLQLQIFQKPKNIKITA